MYHDAQGREIEDLEMDNMKQTQIDEQRAADAQLLTYVKELLDLDVYQFEGQGSGPRYMTQGFPAWNWIHHGFAVNKDGLALNEFDTHTEARIISMDAGETEKLLSVLLEWWLERRIKGVDGDLETDLDKHPFSGDGDYRDLE